jgi:hypothetical protein
VKLLFLLVVVGHGLIHLMGPAKAFGLAELPQLTQPISKAMAMVWLLAAAALLATAGTILLWPRWWWAVATVAAAVSQAAILSSWSDAKYGTIANVAVLVGAVFGYLANRTAPG